MLLDFEEWLVDKELQRVRHVIRSSASQSVSQGPDNNNLLATAHKPTTTTSLKMTTPAPQNREALNGKIYVELTHEHLDIPSAIAKVKSPKAGAVVMFAGRILCVLGNVTIQ